MTDNIFSTNLQKLRKQKGVTQEQLAHYLGVSAQAVSKWENGSYPEGDLLPKMSEFLGVSISYLYGQEKEHVSIEQSVLECLYEIASHESESKNRQAVHREYFDKIMDILWAFQIAGWKNNRNYYDRGIPEKGTRTASILTTEAGISYFNLNKEKQFYTVIREPEDGFAKNMPDIKELRDFYAYLGKEGVLKIVYYLLSLRAGECVTSSAIAKAIGMDIEAVKKLLEEGGQYFQESNPLFYSLNVINQDKSETAYGVNSSSVSMYISLFLNSEVIFKPPYGYQMQINSRNNSWLAKEDVNDILKKEK